MCKVINKRAIFGRHVWCLNDRQHRSRRTEEKPARRHAKRPLATPPVPPSVQRSSLYSKSFNARKGCY